MESRWIPANMEVLGRHHIMQQNPVDEALTALSEAPKARHKEDDCSDAGNAVVGNWLMHQSFELPDGDV